MQDRRKTLKVRRWLIRVGRHCIRNQKPFNIFTNPRLDRRKHEGTLSSLSRNDETNKTPYIS